MLTTDRLVLRPPAPGDLEPLWQMMSDPRAMRFWNTAPHRDRAETRAFLDRLLSLPAAAGEEFMLVERGTVVGRLGLWRIAEVGYMLHPDAWGRGLMHEALTAALPHFFDRFPAIAAITAEVDPQNAASLRLLGRLGFAVTGRAERTLCIDATWYDSVYLSLARPAAVRAPPQR